jgi:hypothetical protein
MPKGLPRSMSRGTPIRQEILKLVFPVRNLTFNITGVATTVMFASLPIGRLPEGNIDILGAVSYFAISGPGGNANLVDTWDGFMSIGSAATADNALAGAEVNIIPSTALGPAVAEIHSRLRVANPTSIIIDNTAGNLNLNLNILVNADAVTATQTVPFNVSGELHLLLAVLGDG